MSKKKVNPRRIPLARKYVDTMVKKEREDESWDALVSVFSFF